MSAKTVACVIARTASTRLPLKVLRDIHPGLSVLDFLIRRIKEARRVDEIYLCTSREATDDILEDVAQRHEIKIYRGSADQVIERLHGVRAQSGADFLIRLTGDNPFIDPALLDEQIKMVRDENLDYVRLTDVPVGATGEVIRSSAMEKLDELMAPEVSEYMMLYLFDPDHFRCGLIKPFSEDYGSHFITIDTRADLRKARHIAAKLIAINDFSLRRVIKELKPVAEMERVPESDEMRVKMPYGKTMAFREFRKMMDSRKTAAKIKQLDEG